MSMFFGRPRHLVAVCILMTCAQVHSCYTVAAVRVCYQPFCAWSSGCAATLFPYLIETMAGLSCMVVPPHKHTHCNTQTTHTHAYCSKRTMSHFHNAAHAHTHTHTYRTYNATRTMPRACTRTHILKLTHTFTHTNRQSSMRTPSVVA